MPLVSRKVAAGLVFANGLVVYQQGALATRSSLGQYRITFDSGVTVPPLQFVPQLTTFVANTPVNISVNFVDGLGRFFDVVVTLSVSGALFDQAFYWAVEKMNIAP